MHDPKSLYAALGLLPSATSAVIKFAYRELAQRYHPDRLTANADKMRAANEAYQVLADPIRRKRYDETGIDETDHILDQRATMLLQNFFSQYLESGNDTDDVVASICVSINVGKRKQVERRATAEGKRVKLLRRSSRLRRKGNGMDLFAAQITHMLRDGELQIARCNQEIDVMDRCMQMAMEYVDGSQPHDDAIDSFVYLLQHFKTGTP